MAEDATAAALSPEPPLEAPASASSKRRRLDDDDGDLRRVAEIVMVLAAMGQMRGGRDPSAAEKSLVAEARRRLVTTCASLRPNDLFTSEAARIIAGDLGFSQQTGARHARKVSIAEKVALTSKKMMEGKEFMVQSSTTSYTPPYVQGSVVPKADFRMVSQQQPQQQQQQLHQGLQKVPIDRLHTVPQAVQSFHTVLPPGHSVSNTTWKQMPFGETQPPVVHARPPGGSVVKDPAALASTSPISVRGEVLHFRSDVRPGVPTYPLQVQVASPGNFLPTKSTITTPAVLTPNMTMPPMSTQVVKPLVQTSSVAESSHGVNMTQTFSLATEHQKSRTSRQTIKEKAPSVEQFQTTHALHPSVNLEIAKSVHMFLQGKTIDLSGWVPPSLDYMSHGLTCQICKISITDVESLLVCDICEKGVHLRCLKSFNHKAFINQEWHCPKCLLASNGRMLPPKYGKVTRSAGASKPSSITVGAHVSPEKRLEVQHASAEMRPQISDPKVHEKVTTGVRTRSSQRIGMLNTNTGLEQVSNTSVINANDSYGKLIPSHSIHIGDSLDKDPCDNQRIESAREAEHCGEFRRNLVSYSCSENISNSEQGSNAPVFNVNDGPGKHIRSLRIQTESSLDNDSCSDQQIGTGRADEQCSDVNMNLGLPPCSIKGSSSEQESNMNDDRGRLISSHKINTGNSWDKDSFSNQKLEADRDARYCGEARRDLGCSLTGSDSEFALDSRTKSLQNIGELSTNGGEICDKPENIATSQASNNSELPVGSMLIHILKDKNIKSTEKEVGKKMELEDSCEKKASHEIGEDVNSESLGHLNDQNEALIDKGIVDFSRLGQLSEQNLANHTAEKKCYEEKNYDNASTVSSKMGSDDGAKKCNSPSLQNFQNADWVGEVIHVVGKRYYYQSCCINDAIYNLQDNVFFPQGGRLYPSKLQALWEDTEDGSKLAMLNRYYFPADIPEAVMKPSTPEKNEIYGSNDSETVKAGTIFGPSTVVSHMKLKVESEVRACLAEGNDAKYPVFFCRWLYDKEKELFLPLSG